MSPKCKHDWHLSRAEAAELLRELADTLEQGADEVCRYGISLDELVKFKIRIDLDGTDALDVQFKAKGSKSCEGTGSEDSDAVGEGYATLKKRMQASFKTLRQNVASGGMPSRATVSAFLSDAQQLLRYEGFGDEDYPAFAATCELLRQAFEAGDPGKTAAAMDDLEQARKRCHRRHKPKAQGFPSGS